MLIGMDRTTQVIMGAALMMVAVLAASAMSGVVNARRFGVGLTVASMMDATVSRRALLPALLLWTGGQWWFPASFGLPSA